MSFLCCSDDESHTPRHNRSSDDESHTPRQRDGSNVGDRPVPRFRVRTPSPGARPCRGKVPFHGKAATGGKSPRKTEPIVDAEALDSDEQGSHTPRSRGRWHAVFTAPSDDSGTDDDDSHTSCARKLKRKPRRSTKASPITDTQAVDSDEQGSHTPRTRGQWHAVFTAQSDDSGTDDEGEDADVQGVSYRSSLECTVQSAPMRCTKSSPITDVTAFESDDITALERRAHASWHAVFTAPSDDSEPDDDDADDDDLGCTVQSKPMRFTKASPITDARALDSDEQGSHTPRTRGQWHAVFTAPSDDSGTDDGDTDQDVSHLHNLARMAQSNPMCSTKASPITDAQAVDGDDEGTHSPSACAPWHAVFTALSDDSESSDDDDDDDTNEGISHRGSPASSNSVAPSIDTDEKDTPTPWHAIFIAASDDSGTDDDGDDSDVESD